MGVFFCTLLHAVFRHQGDELGLILVEGFLPLLSRSGSLWLDEWNVRRLTTSIIADIQEADTRLGKRTY